MNYDLLFNTHLSFYETKQRLSIPKIQNHLTLSTRKYDSGPKLHSIQWIDLPLV